ncbi:MAG: LysM peptidoglycan-binding domain-containing protein, partial [Chitinophagales bacterium]
NFLMDDYNTVPKMNDRSSYKDLTPIKYTVVEGDVLGEISMLYDCSVNELKSWNHLNNDKINAGQRLTVYVARKYKKLYENIEASTQKEILKAPPSLALQNRTGSILPGQVQFRVKKGESLLQISEFFSGVSAEEIRQYNKLPSVNILTNQVITIPVPRSSSQSRSY